MASSPNKPPGAKPVSDSSSNSQQDQIITTEGKKLVDPQYLRQVTLNYKNFIKRTVQEALQNGFEGYDNPIISNTKISTTYPRDATLFPSIVVKFYERTIRNAGIAHVEYVHLQTDTPHLFKMHHKMYEGDLSFEIYAEDTTERDIISDALIEVVAMGDTSSQGVSFEERIYNAIDKYPWANYHYMYLNMELFNGYGETQMIAPWLPEDVYLFQSEYRVGVFGEFYSLPPAELSEGTGLVEKVDLYPWSEADPLDTPPKDFPNGEIPEEDYIPITKHEKEKI